MTLMPQLLGRLRRYWIAFELTEKYHPVRRRRSRDVALEAEAYCQRLSVWPLLKRSISSGASLSDYYFLHRYILSKRPKQVLEFGAGCTTLVMADALHETGGHLFSYEDVPQYYVDTDNLIPSALKNCVTLSLVDKSEVEYPPGLWGVRYVEDIAPEVEMVFVDGPFETVNGRTGACLDVLFYLDTTPTFTSISSLIGNTDPWKHFNRCFLQVWFIMIRQWTWVFAVTVPAACFAKTVYARPSAYRMGTCGGC
jgi:hypothetical protein